MLNTELWLEGGTTMVMGMGIVFCFLVLLVFAMGIMTKCVAIINKLCPLPVEEVKVKKSNSSDESEVALAIAVACAKA